jgi:hypothetical protein
LICEMQLRGSGFKDGPMRASGPSLVSYPKG